MTVGAAASMMRFTVPVRSLVAPEPTGSRTKGLPKALQRVAALRNDGIHDCDNVPILMTTAPEIAANSSSSSGSWAMTGDAPIARRTFAVQFITT
jgi:hypothetical protein